MQPFSWRRRRGETKGIPLAGRAISSVGTSEAESYQKGGSQALASLLAAELLFVYFSLLILFFPPFLLQKFTFND